MDTKQHAETLRWAGLMGHRFTTLAKDANGKWHCRMESDDLQWSLKNCPEGGFIYEQLKGRKWKLRFPAPTAVNETGLEPKYSAAGRRAIR